jgi:hypothetical protein
MCAALDDRLGPFARRLPPEVSDALLGHDDGDIVFGVVNV